MTPEEKASLPLRVEKLFYELQDRIFSDVVRRIKKTEQITSTADYQIEKLQTLGNSSEFIEQEIKRLLGATDAQVWELYDKVLEWEYVRNKNVYEQINGSFVPLEENEQVQQWSRAIVKQTQNEIKNITKSLGMSVDVGGGKKAFTPLAEYYQKYLDRACMDIVSGAFSYNTVLRRVVKEMSASGIQTVDYASGWHNKAVVASRRAVMAGVSQLSAQINEMIAKDLGTESYEVTWHSGHRPEHWWGGRVYTYQELEIVCGLGTGAGLCGWNCHHSYRAFIPGISVRTYTNEQLEEMEARELEVRTFQGKEYNAYQASQMQRQLETKMRAQRTNVKQLKQGKADDEAIVAAQSKYLQTLHQYQAFSKKMNLPEQMERVYMDGLGRIAPSKSVYADYLKKQAEKKAIRAEQALQKARNARFSDRFQEYNNGQKDTITYRRLMNNLNKSEIGKETVEYIMENPELNIMMCYQVDVSKSILGKQEGKDIYIFATNTKTVQRTAEILIHEITHQKYDIGGNQWAECVCRVQELKHRNNVEKLTAQEMRDIIKSVKNDYPELKWR